MSKFGQVKYKGSCSVKRCSLKTIYVFENKKEFNLVKPATCNMIEN